MLPMFFPLDKRNTKKLITKLLSFYKQQMVFSQIVSKRDKAILFWSKNPKNNHIILVISISPLQKKEHE